VALDGARGIDDRFEAAVSGPEVSLLEEAGLGGWLIMEVLQGEPDLVGPCGLEMMRGEAFERRPLPVGQVRRAAQPDVAGAARQALLFRFGAADLVDRIIDDLDAWNLSKVMAASGRFSATP
jgi:hypothetical protein